MENLTSGYNLEHPSLNEYFINLSPFILLSVFIGLLLLILNILICFTTATKLRRNLSVKYLDASIALIALYPIIAAAACTTLLIPHIWLPCHTVMHLSFTIGAIIFRNLCFRYVDSQDNFIKESHGNAISIQTPPLCCCCSLLPLIVPSKTSCFVLRLMVWQMPFVQGSIMIILNVFYYTNIQLYSNITLYFIPFVVSSILTGVWSLNITVRMVNAVRPDALFRKKLLCLQLILILCKFQYILLDALLNYADFGYGYPMTHTVYKQTIINLTILLEMVFVSLLVQNAYGSQKSAPDIPTVSK